MVRMSAARLTVILVLHYTGSQDGHVCPLASTSVARQGGRNRFSNDSGGEVVLQTRLKPKTPYAHPRVQEVLP
jgi:hypothetical protein